MTNNRVIYTSYRNKLEHEEINLIFAIDKIYNQCYLIKNRVSLDFVKILLFKELNVFYTIPDNIKRSNDTKYSNTLIPLNSFNQKYSFVNNKLKKTTSKHFYTKLDKFNLIKNNFNSSHSSGKLTLKSKTPLVDADHIKNNLINNQFY